MPIDDHARQILNQRVDAYERRVQRIRNDKRLSHEGRQRALAKLRVREAEMRKQLVDAAERRLADRHNEVRTALGTMRRHIRIDPMAALSWRDAMAHANQITDVGQAKALFKQAVDGGDEALARAVLNRAIQLYRTPLAGPGWDSILDDWANTHPHEARLVKELRELDAMASSKYATVEVSSYLHPSKPPELANVPDLLQKQWADEPLPDLGDTNDLV